jgi:hypothetical protein
MKHALFTFLAVAFVVACAVPVDACQTHGSNVAAALNQIFGSGTATSYDFANEGGTTAFAANGQSWSNDYPWQDGQAQAMYDWLIANGSVPTGTETNIEFDNTLENG